MSQAFSNLSISLALILLVAVMALVLWGRVRRWNDRQQAWREAERDTLMGFQANSRKGRRVSDFPSIKTPGARWA